jgi:hypothetical protein
MKTIIEMAREAGIRDVTCDGTRGCLERFAALVASATEERNFCPRCGKRLASGFVEISIHTCTPPKGKT